jgi:hypothetical protein
MKHTALLSLAILLSGSAGAFASYCFCSNNLTFPPDVATSIAVAPATVNATVPDFVIQGAAAPVGYARKGEDVYLRGGNGPTVAGSASGDVIVWPGDCPSGTGDCDGGDAIMRGGVPRGAGSRGGLDIGFHNTSQILLGGNIMNPSDGATIQPNGEFTGAITFQTGMSTGQAALRASDTSGTAQSIGVVGGKTSASGGKGGLGFVWGGDSAHGQGGDVNLVTGQSLDGSQLSGSISINAPAGSSLGPGAINIGDSAGGVNSINVGYNGSTPIGLYGATATGQYSTTGTVTGFSAGSSVAVNSDSTFTGGIGSTAYTTGDVVRALKKLGVMAQ